MKKLYGVFVILALSFPIYPSHADVDDETTKLDLVAGDFLKRNDMQELSLQEFPTLETAALCIAIGIDFILFTDDQTKSSMNLSDRLAYHIMFLGGKYSAKRRRYTDDDVSREVKKISKRLERDENYLYSSIDLCVSKANKFIYE